MPGWSLGVRSQLLAVGFDALIEPRGDWWVVRTPDNPHYYWGNFLLTGQAPRDADLATWTARAQQEISRLQPQSDHVALDVDAALDPASLPSWTAAGFEMFETTALCLEPAGLQPAPALPEGAVVRQLRLPGEAAAAVDLQLLCDAGDHEPVSHADFRRRVMERTSRMDARGLSHWFGVFVDGRLVADCGLVHGGAGTAMGRFRDVETHPAFRRRGLCRALVHHVCRVAFGELRLGQLVMCADPHDVAIGIYESVGFRRAGTHWQLQRRSPGDHA